MAGGSADGASMSPVYMRTRAFRPANSYSSMEPVALHSGLTHIGVKVNWGVLHLVQRFPLSPMSC